MVRGDPDCAVAWLEKGDSPDLSLGSERGFEGSEILCPRDLGESEEIW